MQNIPKKQKFKLNIPAKLKSFDCNDAVIKFQESLNVILVRGFENLGGLVARRWPYFVAIPLILGCIAISGLHDVQFDNDFERLSLPIKGLWKDEMQLVERLFHKKKEQYFDPSRLATFGHYVNLIITSKTAGGSILEDAAWKDIMHLDDMIMETKIEHGGKEYQFYDICPHWKGICFSPLSPIRPNDLSYFSSLLQDAGKEPVVANVFPLEYTSNFLNFTLQLLLGQPQFNDKGILESAEAMSLFYWLKSEDEQDVERAEMWESQIYKVVKEKNSSEVDVSFFAARTPGDEMEIANNKMKPLLALSGFLMVLFVCITNTTSDAVRSKMLVSILGIASVMLGTGSAFGILVYSKVSFIGINYAAVFLMLGIGIDDMFVLLSAWRLTDIQDSVENRMRAAYGHACVSVTVTSLTNIIAFFIGSQTSIRPIEIFSIYSCFSAFLSYIFFLTFFGGSLAAVGLLEASQRHSIFCIKVKPKSEAANESVLYRMFLSGGVSSSEPSNPEDNEPHRGMVFVRDTLGSLLSNPACRVCIIVSYVLYLGIMITGLFYLEQETHPDRVSFQESTQVYFEKYDTYYNSKPSFVQVVFTEPLEYSNPETRIKIMNLHDSLEDLPFVDEHYTTSWIRKRYNQLNGSVYPHNHITTEETFVHDLREAFHIEKDNYIGCHQSIQQFMNYRVNDIFKENMTHKLYGMIMDFPCSGHELMSFVSEEYLSEQEHLARLLDVVLWIGHILNRVNNIYEMDINFSPDYDRIDSSRFLILIRNANDIHVQKLLRETVENSGISGVRIFNFQAFTIEQSETVKLTTFVSITLTTVVILFISFVLIPSAICSLWIAFCVVSIELGVIGLMALWGVKLNGVSMVNLIMCVGFSVDFSAHISYAYMKADGLNSKDWTREAIYNVGLPIILGGLSTIVGIIPICFSNSGVFIIFFKIILLVIVLGMIHSLIYLPFFMGITGSKKCVYDIPKFSSFSEIDPSADCGGVFTVIEEYSTYNFDSNICKMCSKRIDLTSLKDSMEKRDTDLLNIKSTDTRIREENICKHCLLDSNCASLGSDRDKEGVGPKLTISSKLETVPQLDNSSVVTSSDSAIEMEFMDADESVSIETVDVELLQEAL